MLQDFPRQNSSSIFIVDYVYIDGFNPFPTTFVFVVHVLGALFRARNNDMQQTVSELWKDKVELVFLPKIDELLCHFMYVYI